MATAATPPTVSPPSAAGYDQFVDSRIARTQTAVKSADLATGVVVLMGWTLVVVLVAAIADHWLVAGGLDRWERYSLWGIGLAGAALYTATRLGPNLLRRVNPLYAAREIERETPELKNSLLNLLQLRGAAESPSVKQALERQAAERLVKAGDAPIDHTPLVRAAKLLLVLVAVIGVYVVASPKDLFASAGRVLAPWSQIAAPTRVRITAIEPGDITLAQGERLNIAAMVSGLRDDELVELVYTTDDRQAVGRRVPMTTSRGGLQFSGALPAGSGAATALGLQGSLTYRIEAGDAHSASYHVDVLTAPTIAPVSVRYDYPAYTGFEPRTVEGGGDLRALQGTRVTLEVEANLPIESAQIDLGADGRPDVTMTAEGRKAQAAFALRLEGNGPSSTNNYVLRFTSQDGQANHNPPQYQIEVLADLAPEVALLEPEAETTDVALHARAPVVVEARDPDFALTRVRLVGETGGRRVLDKELLQGSRRGRFSGETDITPGAIGLRPGDVLDFWVEATDNRTPQPNVTVSERRQLRVLAPADGGQRDRREGDGGGGQQQPRAGDNPQQDSHQKGENGEGQPGEQPQDGGAGGQANQRQPGEGQKGDQQQPGEAGENGQQGGQTKSQAGEEENSQGDEGQPPPGGLTGPGNKGGDNSSDQSGDGNEGSSTSKPSDGANSPAGGSQPGEPGADQPPSAGQQQGGDGGDPSASGKQSPNKGQQSNQPQAGDPGSGEQSGGEQSGGESAGESPVARDGSDDGSAVKKMLEWLKQQQGSKQSGKPSSANEDGSDNPSESEGSQDGDEAPQNEGGSTQDDGKNRNGEARDGKNAQDRPSKGPQSTSQSGADGERPADDGDGHQAEADPKGNEGEQGKSGQGGSQSKQQTRKERGGKTPDRGDGPGAGERDRSGQQSPSKSSESGGDKPPGESTDRDAGPREGADGAGQSQAADRGAGQSADKGAGDSSGRAGGEEESDSPTGGESGDERGKGSDSRESNEEVMRRGLEQPGGAGDKQQGNQQQSNQQQGGKQQNGQSQKGQQGKPTEGNEGQPGQNPGDTSQPSGDAQQNSDQQKSLDDKRGEGARDSRSPVGDGGGPMELGDRGATSDAAGEGAESGGDAANLDYARKQTELVLQRLEEQLRKKEVDRKLLDKLGWTDEDLREFVDRWQARRQKAAERGAQGEAELDRALRSLGLSPNGPTEQSKVTEDSLRDLRESARAKTPPRLRDSVEWYLRSVNAADKGSADGAPAGEE